MKPSQILKSALNLLEEKGWTQHDYARDSEGLSAEYPKTATCFCGKGALRMTTFGGWTKEVKRSHPNFDSYILASTILQSAVHPDNVMSYPAWQDAPGRTFAEVKELFLKAIGIAEKQELEAAA